MSDNHHLLEILQADVCAVLQATPALAAANVFADNDGDIEARVAKALGALTETGGKQGLAVVVLLPEVTDGEANLPGPPLTVKVEIRVLEHVVINRASSKGTMMRSSVAALNVLAALHLRHLGHCLLSAQKDPVSTVDVKKGHVSHAVTLTAKFNGLVAKKPAGVRAVLMEGGLSMVIRNGPFTKPSGPVVFPVLLRAGIGNGRPYYTPSGIDNFYGSEVILYWNVDAWYLASDGGSDNWRSLDDVATPDLATTWGPTGDALGVPEVMAGGFGELTITGDLSALGHPALAFPPLPYQQAGPGGRPQYGADAGEGFHLVHWVENTGVWEIYHAAVSIYTPVWSATDSALSPELVESWTPQNNATGTPLLSRAADDTALELTCETPDAAIHYTTDGRFPAALAVTRYSVPIAGLAAGTVVRAAAYVTGQVPGDVTELTVTA